MKMAHEVPRVDPAGVLAVLHRVQMLRARARALELYGREGKSPLLLVLKKHPIFSFLIMHS